MENYEVSMKNHIKKLINPLKERKKRLELILKYDKKMNNAKTFEELMEYAKELKEIEPSFELQRYLDEKVYL